MLMKKLIVFKNETNFKKELEQGNIMPTSWVVVKDTKKLYVQNTEIEGVNWDKVQQLIDTAISEIDLENQLTEYVKKNELENYYTKTESDEKYLTEHQSLEDYYNKTQVESKLNEKVDKTQLNDYLTKSEAEETYLKEHQSLSNYYQKSETYSKEEVDNLIEDIDVTDQLEDYALKSDVDSELEKKADKTELSKYAEIEKTTLIKTESGEVIKELTVVEGGEEDSIEVYTKEQCDERFMKVWFGSESDYNSLGKYDNNTIYVIQ